MTKRTKLFVAAPVLIAAAIVAYLGQCSSAPLPKRLSRDELQVIAATRIHATLGVEGGGAQRENLVRMLSDSKMFDRVDRLDAFTQKPDLVLRIVDLANHANPIPCFTAVSLGIIPTIADDEFGYSFTLSRPNDPGNEVYIPFKYRGSSVLGWGAVFFNLTPNYTSKDPEMSPRFRDGIALAVASRRSEIESLLKR